MAIHVGSIVRTLINTPDTMFDPHWEIGRNCYNDKFPKGTVCLVQEIINETTVTIKRLEDEDIHSYFAPLYDLDQIVEVGV